MSKQIKITLIKSLNGRLPKHVEIAKQIGVTKINRSAIHDDTASMRGLINIISYLVRVEECSK